MGANLGVEEPFLNLFSPDSFGFVSSTGSGTLRRHTKYWELFTNFKTCFP